MSKKEGFNVTVLNRRDVTTFPKLGVPLISTMVTYIAAGLPPATVTIVKSKYNLKLEQKLIKADIEKRLKHKPETYHV